jgi:protein TonB
MSPVSGGDAAAVSPLEQGSIAMFDTYMDAHALDPRMRRRMGLAMGAAVIASALAITTYSGVERMSIARVGAPQVASPMAAPPPPPPQQASAAAPSDDAVDDAEPTRTASDDVDELLEAPRRGPTRGAPTGNSGGAGTIPGAPVGPPGIGMPCIGGHCTIGLPPAQPRTPPAIDTTKVPLSVAEGRVRFSPDPPREALLATRAGQLQRGGTSVVEFCVGTDGKVERVSTKRSAGDGDVDRICRDTVKRWRFSPLQVQGRAIRMCSEMSFVIAFE